MRSFVGILLVLILALAAPAEAEPTGQTPPINRSSPRDTYQSFLTATGRLENLYAAYAANKSIDKVQEMRRDLRRIRRLMDLSTLPASTRVKVGNAAIGYLYDILARLPPLDPGEMPGPPVATTADGAPASDSRPPVIWTVPGTDIQIAYVENGLHSGSYLFTAESIANLPQYYDEIVDSEVLNPRLYENFHLEQINATGALIPEQFVEALPDVLKDSYLGTPGWKILADAIILTLLTLLAVSWIWFTLRRAATSSPLRRILWQASAPLVILALLRFAEWFVAAQLNPAGTFAAGELMLSTAIRFLGAAWLAWLAVRFIVEAIIRSPHIPEDSYDSHLLRLLGRIIGMAAVGTILVLGADDLGIPAMGLVAGLGVGGIAVALASQSTLENLFGGVTLFADRPFRIGDRIQFNAQTATVERIGPRSSRLRARDGTLCTVPNSDLARSQVVNFTMRDGCFLDQIIAVRDDSAPERLEELLVWMRALFDDSALIEKKEGWPRIHTVGMMPGQIRLRFQARVLTTDYAVFLAEQERLLLAAVRKMRALGIRPADPVAVAGQTAGNEG